MSRGSDEWYRPMTIAVRAAIVAVAFALAGSVCQASAGTPAQQVTTRNSFIVGNAWNSDNTPLPDARLRLRDVVTGHVIAATTAYATGHFAFPPVAPGTYLVELVNEDAKILCVGNVFGIGPGETVATFVRLGTKVPWFAGFFNNAAAALAVTAASYGITALAPAGRPASAGK